MPASPILSNRPARRDGRHLRSASGFIQSFATKSGAMPSASPVSYFLTTPFVVSVQCAFVRSVQ